MSSETEKAQENRFRPQFYSLFSSHSYFLRFSERDNFLIPSNISSTNIIGGDASVIFNVQGFI